MSGDWTDQHPSGGEAHPPSRPYGTRPYGTRPYGTRPYGTRPGDEPAEAERPYGTRPYGTRPFGTRPYGTRPYGTRPYGTRPGDEPGAEACVLDPEEWSADVADLFHLGSAVIRLGARVVWGGEELPIPAVEPAPGVAKYVGPVPPTDPGQDEEPVTGEGAEKPVALVSRRILRPPHHELATTVVLPNQLLCTLVEQPEIAWALKDDVAAGLSGRADRAFLRGDGVGEPLGLENTRGVGAIVIGDLLARARRMVAWVRGRPGARFRSPGWIIGPGTLDALAVLRTRAGVGNDPDEPSLDMSRLLRYDGCDGGLLLGYPFVVAAAAEERLYFSSDWHEAWIAVDRALVTVDVSADVRFRTDETVVRAVMHHDFLLRRPALFVHGRGEPENQG